jgi:hypothetical protein
MRSMRGFASVVFGAVVVAMVGAPGAEASITLGQLAPSPGTGFCAGFDRVQPSVSSGNGYVVPAAGTITSWSTNAGANAGQHMAMKVFRNVSGNTYSVVGHDGPQPLTENTLNTFAASIAVKAGDVVGMDTPSTGSDATYCDFPVIGDSYLAHTGSLSDGASAPFNVTQPDDRLNITAVFVPSNVFSFGGIRRNTKAGTATLAVELPGPGELTISGAGLTAAAPGALPSTAVSGPGEVQVLIRATGAKLRKLRKKGKVALSANVTYTPSGGDASAQAEAVPLKRKLKKRR